MRSSIILSLCLLLSACGELTSREGRIFDADAEFAKLDGPEVPTLKSSLERAAVDALADGENERAAGLYKQLTDHDPEEVRYKLGLAESLRRLGDYRLAVELYDMVIRKHPGHVDAFEGKALAMMANGDTEDAARIFKKILQRDKDRWRTLNALGILFAIKNLSPEANAYFAEALRASPNNPSVLNNKALVDALQRRFRASIQGFEKAARQADGLHRQQIELNQALVYGIAGDFQAAEKLASKHLDDGALKNNLGLYAHLANDKELSKSYLNMALTGTSVHYKRAWENLDIIAKEGKGGKPEGKSFKVQ